MSATPSTPAPPGISLGSSNHVYTAVISAAFTSVTGDGIAIALYTWRIHARLIGYRLDSCLINRDAVHFGYVSLIHGSVGDATYAAGQPVYTYPYATQQTKLLDRHTIAPNYTPNSAFVASRNTAYWLPWDSYYPIQPNDLFLICAGAAGSMDFNSSATFYYIRTS